MNGMNKKNKMAFSIVLNRIDKVQGSDTTGAESSNAVDKQKKNTVLLIIFVLIAFSSTAQRILTLEEAIANTLQKNYDIILSKNDSAITACDYCYVNAAVIPRLNGNIVTVWKNNDKKQTLA